MKPPTFDGTQDPIKAMRWVSDLEGCFFTCLCPTDLEGQMCPEPAKARGQGLVEADDRVVH